MTKLFVATPAYNGWLHMSYYKTVLEELLFALLRQRGVLK